MEDDLEDVEEFKKQIQKLKEENKFLRSINVTNKKSNLKPKGKPGILKLKRAASSDMPKNVTISSDIKPNKVIVISESDMREEMNLGHKTRDELEEKTKLLMIQNEKLQKEIKGLKNDEVSATERLSILKEQNKVLMKRVEELNFSLLEPVFKKIENLNPMKKFTGHTSYVYSLAVTNKGNTQCIASGSYFDKIIRIWDPTKDENDTFVSLSAVTNIRAILIFDIGPNKFLAVGGEYSDDIDIWSLKINKIRYILRGHKDDVLALLYLKSKRVNALVSGSSDRTIKLWDVTSSTCIATLKGHFSGITSLAVFNDKKGNTILISGSVDRTVRLWDTNELCEITILKDHRCVVYVVKVFTKGDDVYLASGSEDKDIQIYNLSLSATKEATLTGHTDRVYSLTSFVIWKKPFLASGGSNGTIKIWDLDNYQELKTLHVPDSTPTCSLTTYNDRRKWFLVSGHKNGNIFLWTDEKNIT